MAQMNSPLDFAKVIKRAAELREASWVSKKMTSAAGPVEAGEYTKRLEDCVDEAAKEARLNMDFAFLISLAFDWWNDILEWADMVLAGRSPHEEMMQGGVEMDKDLQKIVDSTWGKDR